MTSLPKILICDDDQLLQLALRQALKSKFEISSAYNGDEAVAIIKNRKIDILLLDVQIRTPREGLDYLPKLKAVDEDLNIVMLSGHKDFETVREAMKLGATDYIPKDVGPDELLHSLSRVLERKKILQRQTQQSFETSQAHKKHILVGESSSIQSLRKLIDKIKSSSANVVIHGETGTGKEVVARLLRNHLPDGSLAPFVSIDSSTIHSNTAESILFGHEKGAFTGADKLKKGIFEEANGGIVYFDEIANMSLEIQSKLLRVIQEKEVTRLGSSRAIITDFRVICATNRKLEEMAQQKLFKEDLYQRLNVIPVMLPPLRDRKEDIPLLADHFIQLNATNEKYLHFTEDAIAVLQAYSWPGNIRELANLVAYLFAVTETEEIDVSDLPPKFRDTTTQGLLQSEANSVAHPFSFYEKVATYEKDLLTAEYSKSNGNISKLAMRLGMDRSHLYTKLRLYKLHSAPQNQSTTQVV